MLDDCRTAFAAGEHLLAHAPTGLGKTAAALTAAVEVARERGLLVVALTSRQTQHAIFVETLKRIHERHPLKIVDVISKGNSPGHSASSAGISSGTFSLSGPRARTSSSGRWMRSHTTSDHGVKR